LNTRPELGEPDHRKGADDDAIEVFRRAVYRGAPGAEGGEATPCSAARHALDAPLHAIRATCPLLAQHRTWQT